MISLSEMTMIRCGQCDVVFSITTTMYDRRREDGEIFYCPNGHPRGYTGELERLRNQVKTKDYALTAVREDLARERESKERIERKLKRVDHGVCPKCSRTFHNLRRHMKTKHRVKRKQGRLPA